MIPSRTITKISVKRALVTNTSCKQLKISNLKTKKHRQMDIQSKLLTHAFKWMDIVCKGHNVSKNIS